MATSPGGQYGGYPPQGQGPPSQVSYQQQGSFPAPNQQPGNQFNQPMPHGIGPPASGVSVVKMAKPDPIPGCPPGLEYLTQIDFLSLYQRIELLDVFTHFEAVNRYQILNGQGQQVYIAGEESDPCHRHCCGAKRAFVMHITDNNGAEVIRVNREFKCCAGCNCCAGCGCCAMEVLVEAPPGNFIGKVKQQASCCSPTYLITNEFHQPILRIEGPICFCRCPLLSSDIQFFVLNLNGLECGRISKHWAGCLREVFTNADNFGVTFSLNLDAKSKAIILGAVFLIDFMFFERGRN